MDLGFQTLLAAAAVTASALAAVVGFGIGSVLTPVFAIPLDTKLAVAAVSLPHVVGTARRWWRLQGSRIPELMRL